MRFLSSFRRALLVGLLLVPCTATALMEDAASLAAASDVSLIGGLKIKDTMNFVDCVQPKRSFCTTSCPGGVLVGQRYTYREPVAVVEVTCKTGESPIIEGTPAGRAVKEFISAAKKTVIGEEKCQVQRVGGGGQSTQTQWFFNVHAFGTTFGSRLEAAGANYRKQRAAAESLVCDFASNPWFKLLMKGEIDFGNDFKMPENVQDTVKAADNVIGKADAFARDCSPMQSLVGNMGGVVPFGLIPAFISELGCIPWPTVNPADIKGSVLTAINTGAVLGSSELSSLACMGDTLYDDAMDQLDGFDLGDGSGLGLDGLDMLNEAKPCVGTWGARAPVTGWTSHKIKPVAAALIAYRGYAEAAKRVSSIKNTKGTLKFNMDYPFINGSGLIPGVSLNPFGKNHGHKGSGCYNVGTMDPRWYTAGESFLSDPSQLLGSAVDDIAGSLTGKPKVSNGDYVFTFWKNSSCCTGSCIRTPPLPPIPFYIKKEY